MKKFFPFLIALLFISVANAQVKDSINELPFVYKKKGIDTTNVFLKIDLAEIHRSMHGNAYFQKEDSIQISKFVTIDKKVLDSLLKPFYFFSSDTVYMDTMQGDLRFRPRYRRVVNAIKQDTSYVSIPKPKSHIAVNRNYGIDTLEITNPLILKSIKRLPKAKDPVWWKNKNTIALDINEVAYINWNTGGSNSIAGLLKIYFERNYQKIYTLWENQISVRYGLNEQENKGLIKTDDEIKLSSSFGYRRDSISNWYYSVKLNFNTQFTNGYKYPDTKTPISRFFAPAYAFLGVGAQYNLKPKNFSAYLSPITLKSTYVLDEDLSNDGAFGVEIGKRSRHEFGALVQSSWVTEVFKNVAMTNQLSLYSDYLNKFGNIDVDWVLKFQFKINDFLEANFRTHLIYDDDIKHKEDTNGDGQLEVVGPRVQFKQQLGIGVLYKF